MQEAGAGKAPPQQGAQRVDRRMDGRGTRRQEAGQGPWRHQGGGEAFTHPGSLHYLQKKDRSRYSKIVTHINLNVQDTHVSFWVLPVFLCSWC